MIASRNAQDQHNTDSDTDSDSDTDKDRDTHIHIHVHTHTHTHIHTLKALSLPCVASGLIAQQGCCRVAAAAVNALPHTRVQALEPPLLALDAF